MELKRVTFHNFKVLRDTELPLRPFTLIVGPNGSGKTSALEGISLFKSPGSKTFADVVNKSVAANIDQPDNSVEVSLIATVKENKHNYQKILSYTHPTSRKSKLKGGSPAEIKSEKIKQKTKSYFDKYKIYSLIPDEIKNAVTIKPGMELKANGSNLSGVLDRYHTEFPDRFEELNREFTNWLPEYDQVVFETPSQGKKRFKLRNNKGDHIKATELSQGTLLALCLLTISYDPDPPSIIGIEEPDRGLHPRLMEDVRDALYRLSYPEAHNLDRDPVQVIATTHSPYLLDLYKDHPEEIVIAEKKDHEATFHQLSEKDDIDKILEDARLGETWYTGTLGGVPVEK